MIKDILTKNSILVGVIFLVITAVLYPFRGTETIAGVMWFTVSAGAIFILFGIATFFEKKYTGLKVYDSIPTDGVKVKTNSFPTFLVLFYFGAIILLLFVFGVRGSALFFLIALVALLFFGLLLRRYVLYPDRIVLLDILQFPWVTRMYKTIYFKDIVSINNTNFSVFQAGPIGMANAVQKRKFNLAFFKLASLLVRKGTSQSVVIYITSSFYPFVLVNVYQPDNLIDAIKRSKSKG